MADDIDVRKIRDTVLAAAKKQKQLDMTKNKGNTQNLFDVIVEEKRKRNAICIDKEKHNRKLKTFRFLGRLIFFIIIVLSSLFCIAKTYEMLFPKNTIEETGFVTIEDFRRAEKFMAKILDGGYSKNVFASGINAEEINAYLQLLEKLKGGKTLFVTTGDCECDKEKTTLLAECVKDDLTAEIVIIPSKGKFYIKSINAVLSEEEQEAK